MLNLIKILFFFCCFFTYCLKAEIREITIIHTTDIHGHIINDEKPAWLKLAAEIRKVRRKAGGKKKTLVLDSGDTLQGSISATLTKGKIAAVMMNTLNYDAWVIGNHDFDFGFQRLCELCGKIHAVSLAANLIPEKNENLFKKWIIFNRNGLKIAVIGITYPFLDHMEWGNKLKGFEIINTIETLDKVMPRVMKEKPNIIILLVHNGLYSISDEKENSLFWAAQKYPQINLVLGGHTHQIQTGRTIANRTVYMQSGMHGEFALKIKIKYDTEEKKLIDISSAIIQPGRKTSFDKKSFEKTAEILETVKMKSEKTAAVLNHSISAEIKKNQYSSELTELCGKTVCRTSNSDFAFVSPPRPADLNKGPIKFRDIYKIFPYEDNIGTLDLTKEDIKKVLREQIKHFPGWAFQSPYGFNFEINDKNKIILEIPEKIRNKKKFRTAFLAYQLSGGGNKYPLLRKFSKNKNKNPEDTGISIRKAFIKYLLKKNKNKKFQK